MQITGDNMEYNERFLKIAALVDKCKVIVDVGTDHGYIPIYLVRNNICEKAIASDINEGPLKKAAMNVSVEGMADKIQCRRGSGLSTVKPLEVQGAVIAGMGGNLIKDIIEEGLPVFKQLSFAVLQPVQNPEVLRRYVLEKGYKILDEALVYSEGKFYEIMKVRYDEKPVVLTDFDYEFSSVLLNKKEPVMKEYLEYKLQRYIKINESLQEESAAAKERKKVVLDKIKELKELILCL
jgi:tRNA (adenine22-N1)-methyltransferase